MAKTYYGLQDGQYEVEAYLDFGRRVNLSSYNRFIRLLNQTNSKGAKGVSLLLQAEATTAFTKRVAMAKKLGEEASTKLLFPLILMMMVLFAIIIAPAAMEFIRQEGKIMLGFNKFLVEEDAIGVIECVLILADNQSLHYLHMQSVLIVSLFNWIIK